MPFSEPGGLRLLPDGYRRHTKSRKPFVSKPSVLLTVAGGACAWNAAYLVIRAVGEPKL